MSARFDMRVARLRDVMRENGLDAIAIAPGPTFHYITGAMFKLLERPKLLLVPLTGQPVMLLPNIEAERWKSLGLGTGLITWRDETGFADAFAELARQVPAKAVGIESLALRYQEYAALAHALPAARFVDVQAAVTALRANKAEDELALIRRAIAYSEAALEKTFATAKVGMTESEVQSVLFGALLEHPLREVPECVCVAGTATAQPHGRARPDYRLKRGDALLIDFAIRCDGYYADITRTVFLEMVSDEHRAFYETVLRANELGRRIARPGMTAGELDDEVLKVLEASPWGKFILHKTGHGIGLDVHEPPMVMRGNTQRLAPGNVITIEPGLYDPTQLGVRIEDDVLITADGAETLTSYPRELMIIG